MAEKYMNPREAIIELNRLKTGVRTPTDFDRRDRAIETAKAGQYISSSAGDIRLRRMRRK